MNLPAVISISLLTLVTVYGDSFLKKAGQLKNTNYTFLIIGLVVYVVTGVIWFFLYKQTKFSIVGSVYGVATAVVFALVGTLYFKETIRLPEIVGMILAVTSIILLGRFGN
jgi:small multidrug resistance pump